GSTKGSTVSSRVPTAERRQTLAHGANRVARTPGFGVRGLSTGRRKSRGPQNRGSALPSIGGACAERSYISFASLVPARVHGSGAGRGTARALRTTGGEVRPIGPDTRRSEAASPAGIRRPRAGERRVPRR